MPGGISFEIWPLEKGRTLTSHPFGVQSKPGPLGPDYLLRDLVSQLHDPD
jgi:hypothetical protein